MVETLAGVPLRLGFCFHPAAHYRQSLIERIDADPRVTVEFLFDDRRSRQPLRHVDPSVVKCFIRAPFRMRFGVVWQQGIVWRVLVKRYDALIMTGDAHDLSTWLSLIIARANRTPVVLWTQGWRTHEGGLKNLVRRSFYGLAKFVLVYGERARDIGIKGGFPADKIDVTYNSVPDSQYADFEFSEEEQRAYAERQGFGQTLPLVLFASRMKSLKQPGLLVNAAAQLARQGTPVELVFVGDGEERRRVEKLAEEAGVKAHFLGAVYDQREFALIASLSACSVLPAHAGLAVMQSLQHGLPVVVNDDAVGNNPEVEAVVPGITGQIYRKGSIQDLARSIASAIAMRNDPRVRRECKRMVHEVWSAENQSRIMVDTVTKLTDLRRG